MEISDLNHQSQSFILLINVKMPTIVGILIFMSRINFELSLAEHEKSFITSDPGISLVIIVNYKHHASYSSPARGFE